MSLTIVTYHYVREIKKSPWPRIRGRETSEFQGQLDWLRSNRTIVSMDQVAAAWRGETDLPPDAALLTFDDGLREHHATVLPILAAAAVPAAFFVSSEPLESSRVLDVHRIHFILAAGVSPIELAAELDRVISERGLGDVSGLHRRFQHSSSWDPAETVYVKRVLQRGLPRAARRELTSALFERYVTSDEAGFSGDLYCGAAELRDLFEAGMHLGSHAHSHDWLTDMPEEEIRDEIERSLVPIRAAGMDLSSGWTLCYPYGGHDDAVVSVADRLGCDVAVTIEFRDAIPGVDHRLRLPRLDTNLLPTSPRG